MKRATTVLIALLVGLSVVGAVRLQSGNAESAEHPIVGSWRWVSGESGVGVIALYTFSADGTVVSTDRGGITWLGAWTPIGPDQVAYTIEAANSNTTGMGQSFRFAIGTDRDKVQLGPDVLQRIVPDE